MKRAYIIVHCQWIRLKLQYKMKKILLQITFFLTILFANAQSPIFQWAKGIDAIGEIGGDHNGKTSAVDATGNVYTTGSFNGTVDFDPGAGVYNLTSDSTNNIFISKLDASGNFVWAKMMSGIGSSDSGAGISIVVDATDNVYTIGYFSGTIDFDPGAGIVNLTGGGIFISKLDASGNFVWAKNIGGTGSTNGYSIAVDATDNVYTTGYFDGTIDFDPGVGTFNLISSGVSNTFISKLDSSGNFIWAKNIGGTGSSTYADALSIAVDAMENVYTTGYFGGTVDFDPGAGIVNLTASGGYNTFISKLDASGNFVWARNMGGTGSTANSVGNSIAIDAVGNVYTTGYFSGTVDFDPCSGADYLTTSNDDMFISKLDASGNLVWTKNMGETGSSYSRGNSIALDATGNVYTTGWFQGTADFDPGAGTDSLSTSFRSEVFISKLDTSGNFIWAVNMGGASTTISGLSLVVDGAENVYTTGYFDGTADLDPGAGVFNLTAVVGYDYFVQKLSQTITTSINEHNDNNNIAIYPNPATNFIDIETDLKDYSISIFDNMGKLISKEKVNQNKIQIDISNFSNGLYFIQLQNNDKMISKKFIKE